MISLYFVGHAAACLFSGQGEIPGFWNNGSSTAHYSGRMVSCPLNGNLSRAKGLVHPWSVLDFGDLKKIARLTPNEASFGIIKLGDPERERTCVVAPAQHKQGITASGYPGHEVRSCNSGAEFTTCTLSLWLSGVIRGGVAI